MRRWEAFRVDEIRPDGASAPRLADSAAGSVSLAICKQPPRCSRSQYGAHPINKRPLGRASGRRRFRQLPIDRAALSLCLASPRISQHRKPRTNKSITVRDRSLMRISHYALGSSSSHFMEF
jgi:hypothetical protein